MQKQILFVLALCSTNISGMEKQPTPSIVSGDSHNVILNHTAPNITRIHSKTYLNNIEKHPSAMLSAINNNAFIYFYPNRYSTTYFTPMLKNVTTTMLAAIDVITAIEDRQKNQNYAISLSEGHSFAGHAQGTNGDVYASIPIAAAFALSTQLAKQILVIDENLTPTTTLDYFERGNGSIFYPQNNPELFALFNGKIITHDKITNNDLENFLHDTKNGIDLAFCNINVDNPDAADKRKETITSLLHNAIPTIFILSGDKNKHQDSTNALVDYITKTAAECKIDALLSEFQSFSPGGYSHNYADETVSSSNGSNSTDDDEEDEEDDGRSVFKVTTDINNTHNYDGANFIYLADSITIDDNGVMEITLNDKHAAYGSYRYHSPTSCSESDDEDNQ